MSCNKNYSNKIDEESKQQFKNTFNVFNNDINKFILLIRKVVCAYEYLDNWEKVNEELLSGIKWFYNNSNTENSTGSNYNYAKRVCNDF